MVLLIFVDKRPGCFVLIACLNFQISIKTMTIYVDQDLDDYLSTIY